MPHVPVLLHSSRLKGVHDFCWDWQIYWCVSGNWNPERIESELLFRLHLLMRGVPALCVYDLTKRLVRVVCFIALKYRVIQLHGSSLDVRVLQLGFDLLLRSFQCLNAWSQKTFWNCWFVCTRFIKNTMIFFYSRSKVTRHNQDWILIYEYINNFGEILLNGRLG
jgi:hypothetical protein